MQERNDRLLTSKEVAALLRVSPLTLAAWRHRRTGPPYSKLGCAVRYDWEAVRDWVEKCGVRSVGA